MKRTFFLLKKKKKILPALLSDARVAEYDILSIPCFLY